MLPHIVGQPQEKLFFPTLFFSFIYASAIKLLKQLQLVDVFIRKRTALHKYLLFCLIISIFAQMNLNAQTIMKST